MNHLKSVILQFGSYTQFIGRFFRTIFTPPHEFRQIMRHVDDFGAMSLPLIAVVNFIMGLILAMQSRPTMEKFGAAAFIPAMVTISIVRELGPVITALLVAGRVASGIGAELGSMKVTEQIDAMECSGVDPYNYLVTTRVIALALLMPIITLYAEFVGIFGSYVAEFLATGVTLRYYYGQVIESLTFVDVVPGLLKTIAFGFAIAVIGAHKGFNTDSGTEGVGRATTSAVVLSSLWIILIDMILVKVSITYFPNP
ncbi:MAG: ABC transporter permease [Bacteroidetes bacterium]|nr:ABC transporter permease [Bacteroidota bacterium]